MKKIPTLQTNPQSSKAAENVLLWLTHYEIDQRLRAVDEEEENTTTCTDEVDFPIHPFSPELNVGDIRLFSPEFFKDEPRARYAAVVSDWDDGLFLLLPYSPFPVPAVTGELLTGREHFSVATLQTWNAVIAPPELVGKSWLVDSLEEKEIADALAAFRHITAGTPLPTVLTGRVGCPIFKEDDPRIRYQDEETALWTDFRAQAATIIDALEYNTNSRQSRPATLNFAPPPYSKVQRRFERAVPELLAADDGVALTSCLFAWPDDNGSNDIGLQAECTHFDPLYPDTSEEVILEWVVDVPEGAEPVRVLVFIPGVEQAVGTAQIAREDDRLHIQLIGAVLSADLPPVKRPADLWLVVLMEPWEK